MNHDGFDNMLDQLDLRAMLPASKERRTLAVDVTSCLRSAIQSGLLPDGIELNQVALAEHFGVSRVSVREAMRALEAEGWISARAHHRAVVQAVSPERVDQIFELRALLEAHCLGRAIRTIDSVRIKRLCAICDQMDKLIDHNAWLAANRQFHRTLLESPGSDLATELIEQLTSQGEHDPVRDDGLLGEIHVAREPGRRRASGDPECGRATEPAQGARPSSEPYRKHEASRACGDPGASGIPVA